MKETDKELSVLQYQQNMNDTVNNNCDTVNN